MRRTPVAIVLAQLLIASDVRTQTVEVVGTPAPESFSESFDENARVSGSPLVGLHIGSAEALFDPSNVKILRPVSLSESLCVRVVSQDGRYTADNQFRIDARDSAAWIVRLDPLSKKYKRQLAAYTSPSVAIRAFGASNGKCVAVGAVNLPEIRGALGEVAPLIVLANGRSRTVTATLASETGEVIQGECGEAGEDAQIAYDRQCRFEVLLGSTSRAMRLQLVFDDGFSPDAYEFGVLVPGQGR